jgi:ribosomal-protein-serine acetyltransferase
VERLEIAPGLVAIPAALLDPEQLVGFVQRNREHLSRYLPAVAEIDTLEAARSHLAATAERVGRGELCEWHLFADGVLCGAVRLKNVEPQNRKAAVAYYLGADYQGRGIATIAVRGVLGYAFGRLGLNRVELDCAVSNTPSVRVAERLGFIREGELREDELLEGEFVNHYVYGLLRSEFRAGV